MTFVTEVEGDALEAMQDAWDDVYSFTRTELGGAPDWADYVDRRGELFSETELEERHVNMLDNTGDPVAVCGWEFGEGSVLKEMDPVVLREMFLNWIDGRISGGELRSIEGR